MVPLAACLAAPPTLAAQAADPAAAGDPAAEAAADYRRLIDHWRTGPPVAVPEGGVAWSRDAASWSLAAGEVRFLEPTGSGVVTGLVFTGEGRFRLELPDPVERAQYNRVTRQEGKGAVDEPFSALVVRTSDLSITGLFPPPPPGPYAPDKLARQRHQEWLERRFEDADARTVGGLLIPGDEYLRADMETTAFGWLTFEFDGLRQEELLLTFYDPKHGFAEPWVSLDRAEDRRPDGRAGRARRAAFDLVHVDFTVDLTRASRKVGEVGYSETQVRRAAITAELRFAPQVEGWRALPLKLASWAEVTAVRTPEGRDLPFLRDPIGRRTTGLDKQLHDDDLMVLLERPLAAGEERRLSVDYEIDLPGFAPGGAWYPEATDGFLDLHTARLAVTAREKNDVRAMGRLAEDRVEGKLRHLTWEIERPARMVTFAFSEGYNEHGMEREDVPEVVSLVRTDKDEKVFNVTADVVNSLSFFQQVFRTRPAAERIFAIAIPGTHGQSFDGFLHLSDWSGRSEEEGTTERFRAHEVAHQWWGHEVAFASYRDQWLSEAFAEYSAMMFIEAAMEKGRQYYDEMVEAYVGHCLGKAKPSRFLRQWAMETNDRQRQRIGPIGIGYRAATAESPEGYFAQTYIKGALVLHMLRTLLRNHTQGDEVFLEVLRRFQARFRGGAASTEDFVATLAEVAPGDWGWFFDQWVDGTDIPTYAWSWEAAPHPEGGGKHLLRLTVEQSGVSPGFKMPVPVTIELGDDREGQVVVLVDQPRKTLEIPLPARPTKVLLNAGGAVLAAMKKR